MKTTIDLACDPPKTPRVLQVSSMFDLPLDRKLSHHLDADLPLEDRDWSVGMITGPSGSGKSSLARELWSDAILGEQEWSQDAAIIDCFPPGMPIRDITASLSAVGLSSVPSWCKPYAVLSNGEKFRASIARALAETSGLLVIDEYGAVVDVEVCRVASHALQKSVRRAGRQIICITCRGDDFQPWLAPDWTFNAATGEFSWGQVRPRPPIRVEIYTVDRAAWRLFSRWHYLSADLASAAQCFGMWADGRLVGFNSYLHLPHAKVRNVKLAHRTVILPDWQGLGLGPLFADWMGQHLYDRGFRLHYAISQPVLIRAFTRSPRWREVGSRPRLQVGPKSAMAARQLAPRRLNSRVFEYTAPRIGTACPLWK